MDTTQNSSYYNSTDSVVVSNKYSNCSKHLGNTRSANAGSMVDEKGTVELLAPHSFFCSETSSCHICVDAKMESHMDPMAQNSVFKVSPY
jgi:hypothetical protein